MGTGTARPGQQVTALIADIAPEWMEHGSCRGLVSAADDPWFPEVDQAAQTRSAQRVCARCPVAAQCLSYAIEHRIVWGTWGGATPKQRRRMLRARGIEMVA